MFPNTVIYGKMSSIKIGKEILKMKKSEKTINIMTSCDEALAKYVSVMLQSISDNLTDANVRFFLLHSKISSQSIDLLARQCSAYNNLEFHSIIVDTPEIYEKMAIGGGGWCGEAYYSLGAYKYLPADVDRILYLDAADTLVTGNIDDYYFSDFEGMSLIATAARYKVHNNQLVTFNSDDLTDSETLSGITRGIFNSGSYVMNIEKMRQDDCGVETYLGLANMLQEISGNKTNAYWGDQVFFLLHLSVI